MVNSNGYIHDGNWKDDASNGQYIFAEKDGREYFLKRFREPIFPSEEDSHSFSEAKMKECQNFENYKKESIAALKKVAAGGGNIVAPFEIFLDDRHYIMVSYKVDVLPLEMDELVKLDSNKKILLLKTLIMSMKKVHSVKVVHGDLKPENILISETKGAGKLVCKIIDFDDSYFSQHPPMPEDTVGTEPYWSPELAVYKITKEPEYAEAITCKSDIFALGLIFHQYLTGGKFPELYGYTNAYQAVAAGKELIADASIEPVFLQNIINRMLKVDIDDRPDCEEIFAMLLEEQELPEQKPEKKEPVTRWPKVKVLERNPKKVQITFEDGRTRILDRQVAEAMKLEVTS